MKVKRYVAKVYVKAGEEANQKLAILLSDQLHLCLNIKYD
jgi:hypothetical protein